tara:strand:- start:144 stop:1163 length:1020 start_codon:yes stop_codon:yes gene_type:complete
MKEKRPYIIAEIAQTHEGSLGIAHSMIDMVAEAGVSAVKFQCHYASEESSHDEPWRVKLRTQDASRYDYWKRMEFSHESWLDLRNHAKEVNLDFICSPFSMKAVEVLKDIDIDVWKIASGEITNIQMLKSIAESGKKIIISTGLSDFEEITNSIDFVSKINNKIIIMQCTSEYPVNPKNIGLNLIKEYKSKFGFDVGFSDHSGNIYTSLAALTLGAEVIEVHATFHKKIFGPDVSSSLNPDELASLVRGADWIHKAKQNPVNKDKIALQKKDVRSIFLKSIVAKKSIPKGATLSEDNICTKKPLKGISAAEWFDVIGSISLRNIDEGEHIHNKDIKKGT